MLSRLLVVATTLTVLVIAEPFQSAPITPTDSSNSIYTTLSNNGPMAGTGPRRLEPLPTASAEEKSKSIYTTLTHDSPMAAFGQRRLEPLPTSNSEERSDEIYTPLSGDGPMGGKGQRALRQ